jgi:transcriptional regulator with XRE-family HTH domain
MIVGSRLRELREARKLSQGDMEKRTGLLRCYISRVENGHTVPAIETLEKMARALEVPLYTLFYDGDVPPKAPNLPKRVTASEAAWDASGADAQLLASFRRHLTRMDEADRKLLISLARKMAARQTSHAVERAAE